MKIIFLDFDGVINTLLPCFYRKGKITSGFFFPDNMKVNNYKAVKLIEKLCFTTDSKIVVSSSWRHAEGEYYHGKIFSTRECLYNSGLSREIDILGNTTRLNTNRSDEIKQYLNEFPVSNYVVIDDDIVNIDNLILCNCWIGFNEDNYKEAYKILKRTRK